MFTSLSARSSLVSKRCSCIPSFFSLPSASAVILSIIRSISISDFALSLFLTLFPELNESISPASLTFSMTLDVRVEVISGVNLLVLSCEYLSSPDASLSVKSGGREVSSFPKTLSIASNNSGDKGIYF